VKPFTFTLLEIASFGLFYKGNFETLRNGWFLCQIVVFVKMFQQSSFIIISSSVKRIPNATMGVPANGEFIYRLPNTLLTANGASSHINAVVDAIKFLFKLKSLMQCF